MTISNKRHLRALAALSVVAFLAAGCAPSTPTPAPAPTPTPAPSEPSTESFESFPDTSGLYPVPTLVGNDVYYQGFKRGHMELPTLTLDLGGLVSVSFPAAATDLALEGMETFGEDFGAMPGAGIGGRLQLATDPFTNGPLTTIYVGDVAIGTQVYWPYAIYDPMSTVRFDCDGSLVQVRGRDVPNAYCETNGTNELTQYEFSAARLEKGVTTGGDYSMSWKKLWIRNVSGTNVYFLMPISAEFVSSDSPSDAIAAAESLKTLDAILADSAVQARIKAADAFVDSVELALLKPSAAAGQTVTTATDARTFTESVLGFSFTFQGEGEAVLGSPIALPEAIGGKPRTLIVYAMPSWKTERDADGCLKSYAFPIETRTLSVNGQPFCVGTRTEGAMGSVYRTYDYTTALVHNGSIGVVTLEFTIQAPNDVRIYGGCETDADQTKQSCLDLAFNEGRDTAMFEEIVASFRLVSDAE